MKERPQRPDLPIEGVKAAFLEAWRDDRPVVVSAPTGSGKSTRLPAWLLQCCAGRVWVVEPRRVACRALAQWVAAGQGETVGHTVGYRVRFDDRTTASSRVVFVTPGVALNLWAAGGVAPSDVVLVDEFHERGWEVDLFTALVRDAQPEGPRLVVCSATLAVGQLRDRLGASTIEASGRTFPVTIEYRGDAMPTRDDLESRVAAAIGEACRDGAADVLVFLPGKGEIERCARALPAGLGEVIPIHGGLEPRALTQAFEPGSGRKIYLATNVAETSLTLPGVDVVIDSGLVRMRTHRGGQSVLALLPVARSSMDQRAGRAGRVRPGRCLRLWEERFIPEEATPPEVERIELDELVLRAATCGVHGDRLVRLPWVTAPPAFALQDARRRLQHWGTLDDDGAPTAAGRVQAQLPVSWFSARILADAPARLRPLLADLTALLEVGRDLIVDRGAPALTDLLEGAVDEVQVQLRCLRDGDARRHGLHGAALAEARRLSRTLGKAKSDEPPRSEDWQLLIDHLLRTVPEAAFVVRARKPPRGRGRHEAPRVTARPWGNGEVELWLRDYTIPGVESERQPKPPVAGVVLDHEWLGVGRAARGVGRMLLRCELSDFERAGLGQTVATQPGRERGKVVATVERRYATVVLSRSTRAVTGSALWRAAAQLIVARRMRKGLADELAEALHRWRLCARWAAAAPHELDVTAPPEDVTAHLVSRLDALGVDASEDLELIDDTDLLPDLGEIARSAGLGERDLQRLVDDFPRVWAFKGGRCAVDVDFTVRRVTLSPLRMEIKGDPPSKYLPRFRGFAVEFVKASRRQRLR